MNQKKINIISWVASQKNPELVQRLEEALDDIKFEEDSKSMIIGVRPNNTPVIKSDFLKCIQQAEHQIDSGEYTSLDTFELDIENW